MATATHPRRVLVVDAGLVHALIIAIAGAGSDEDRQRSHEAGIDYHLVKPVNPEFIKSLLGRRR